MTEHEHITVCLKWLSSLTAGNRAAQTLYHIMHCLLEKNPDMTVPGAITELSFIAGFVRGMTSGPENWTTQGRFDSVLFDNSYLNPEQPSCMLAHLRNNLPQVVYAQAYLRNVAECARLLIAELEKDVKEQ